MSHVYLDETLSLKEWMDEMLAVLPEGEQKIQAEKIGQALETSWQFFLNHHQQGSPKKKQKVE